LLILFLEKLPKNFVITATNWHHSIAMISYIQNILQRHHKWLLGTLLFIIIVAFVFTIGASPGIGRPKVGHEYLYGHDLMSQSDMENVSKDVVYSALIGGEDIRDVRKNVLPMAVERIIALGIADEFKIPNPSSENLKRYIRTMAAFAGDDGKFSKDSYSSALKMFDKDSDGRDRLSRVLCENYRIGEVESLLAGQGIVFDERVRAYLTQLYTEHDFIVATIDGSGVKVDEDIADATMENFYNEHKAKFFRPQMNSVSVVRFLADDFVDTVGNPSDEQLSKFFSDNRDGFGRDAAFDEISDIVRAAYVIAESTKAAYTAAENFVDRLYNGNVARGSEEFGRILDEFGAGVEKLEPYAKESPVDVDGISVTYLLAACDLDDERYYADPCPTQFGCAVLLLEGKEVARQLSFDEAKSDVKNSVIRKKKLDKFAVNVEKIRREVIASLEIGENVTGVLDENGAKWESYDGISLSNAVEKNVEKTYRMALLAMGNGDRIRLMAPSDDEVLMFIVVARKFPTNDLFAGEKFADAKALLMEQNKNFVLNGFFENRVIQVFDELSQRKKIR
jgi:peptidyl-prolyl cis-trans isomerase D